MGLLDSFERGLERAVNGAFAKTFRSGIQPVEIASALRRELDTQASVVSRDRILVPSVFTVSLNPADLDRMRALGSALDSELDALVKKHAASQGYSFAGLVSITLESAPEVSAGTLRVASQTPTAGEMAWRPALVIDGRTHQLAGSRTVVGRGSDADITIDDTGASRKHVEILWDGERALVRDLGSTNGTTLDGVKFQQASLAPGSVIRIGRTELTFQVQPQARRSQPVRDPDATSIFPQAGV
ncbi:DUF3662 and FHA domain-containing protein [uncultured Microbacterium sp.]|uniref:FhaA domain-containing protein n=1 Tax=uncultured Microbacterium sp. TaxID=191216 RepID=UPI0025EE83C5|nr:DUF3662 and FHA domain-containing protein [uncultured Microbacterium sp.]